MSTIASDFASPGPGMSTPPRGRDASGSQQREDAQDVLDQMKDVASNRAVLVLAAMLVVAVIGVTVFVLLNGNEKEKMRATLNQSQQELARMSEVIDQLKSQKDAHEAGVDTEKLQALVNKYMRAGKTAEEATRLAKQKLQSEATKASGHHRQKAAEQESDSAATPAPPKSVTNTHSRDAMKHNRQVTVDGYVWRV